MYLRHQTYTLYYCDVCILVFLHVFEYFMLLRCMLKFKRLVCGSDDVTQYNTMYAGDFNCQHVNWGYSTTAPDGENPVSCATANNLALLQDPKGVVRFSSHCSSNASATATCEQSRPKQGEGKDQASDTYKWLPCTWKKELSLADSSGAELTSMTSQSILPAVRGSIPHWSRTQQPGSSTSSLMEHRHWPGTALCECQAGQPTACVLQENPLRAFLQENPLRDCHLQTQQTPRRHTRKYVRAWNFRLNNVSSFAFARIMCHVGTKSLRPSIAPSSEPQWGLTLTEPPRAELKGRGPGSIFTGGPLWRKSWHHQL